MPPGSLALLEKRIVACRKCPRLTKYLKQIQNRFPSYWCKPVPLFGDPEAKILLLGLAPGRFGSNRTGRMFTGDASGRFLFKALHELGLASQPTGESQNDGLRLTHTAITAVVRCAPPGNKPLPDELRQCAPYFKEEIVRLGQVNVVVALGRIAHDSFIQWKREQEGEAVRRSRFPFKHGAGHVFSKRPIYLVDVYHPSRQNTQTGRLTPAMFKAGLAQAARLAGTGTGIRG